MLNVILFSTLVSASVVSVGAGVRATVFGLPSGSVLEGITARIHGSNVGFFLIN